MPVLIFISCETLALWALEITMLCFLSFKNCIIQYVEHDKIKLSQKLKFGNREWQYSQNYRNLFNAFIYFHKHYVACNSCKCRKYKLNWSVNTYYEEQSVRRTVMEVRVLASTQSSSSKLGLVSTL